MNVLVIPEDFVKDQYVLKPIISAMLRELVNKTAKVRVCQDPRLTALARRSIGTTSPSLSIGTKE